MAIKPNEMLEQLVRESRSELQAGKSVTHNPKRRSFLKNSVAMAGGAGALGVASVGAEAAALAVPESNKQMGRPLPVDEYGMPSKFEAKVKRRRSDVLVNKQNFSDWSMTPLQSTPGIVTPNGLFYERHHNGVPDINPDTHVLAIHGMVRKPLQLTMADLMRYPAVSKFYFMECSGNGLTDWLKPSSKTKSKANSSRVPASM